MGRRLLILTVVVFLFSFSACKKNVAETKPTSVKPVTAPSIPKDGNYEGKGVVTKINTELGSVELKHEEIKDLMPAMQMEFFVKDKELLKGLAVGDRVDFTIEYKNPTETIVAIKKTP